MPRPPSHLAPPHLPTHLRTLPPTYAPTHHPPTSPPLCASVLQDNIKEDELLPYIEQVLQLPLYDKDMGRTQGGAVPPAQ